ASASASGTATIAKTLARTGQLRRDHREGRFGSAGGASEPGMGWPTPSGVANIVTLSPASFGLPGHRVPRRAWRDSEVRLAIRRVCQRTNSISIVVTEQRDGETGGRYPGWGAEQIVLSHNRDH